MRAACQATCRRTITPRALRVRNQFKLAAAFALSCGSARKTASTRERSSIFGEREHDCEVHLSPAGFSYPVEGTTRWIPNQVASQEIEATFLPIQGASRILRRDVKLVSIRQSASSSNLKGFE